MPREPMTAEKSEEMRTVAASDLLDWIEKNLTPEEVFDVDALCVWLSGRCEPDNVFDGNQLNRWARKNGYVRNHDAFVS